MPKSRGHLYIVSAPSGAGKTSLTRALVPKLVESGIKAAISVSYTTRAPRPGEKDGIHYHFVDEPTFLGMVARAEFYEHAEVFGRRYGTGRVKTEYLLADGIHVILDIDWQGGRQVKQKAPDATSIFILPPSLGELERRLRERGQDMAEVIESRMQQAQDEIAHCIEYDGALVNADFALALDELAGLFKGSELVNPLHSPKIQALLAELLDK